MIESSNEYILMHHGVKGMKWGVRKNSVKNKRRKTQAGDVDTKTKKKTDKERTARAITKGARVASKLMMASAIDDIFYGGAGKKIAKEAVIQTGRAAVTAYTMARGGYDIKWYDKQGRRVG